MLMMTIPDRRRTCSNNPPIRVADTQCLVKFYEKNEDYRDLEASYEGRDSLNRKIHFHIGNITDFKVDAIVCSTQTDLCFVPYGIHKEVTRRAGARYQEYCRQVGHCYAGKAFITHGYDLHTKHIIHTAGPSPDTALSYEERQQCLKRSYLSCLKIVKKSPDIRTVAFPCLGSGGAGLQMKDAISIGVTTIREWLETGDNISQVDSIVLVMYDEGQWDQYYSELFKTFPYGKDLAGIDLERLDSVDERTLAEFMHQTCIHSNILCFQYKKSASKYINRHFHSLVNTVHKKVCLRNEPLHRYRNCATFVIKPSCEHRIIIYQGHESLTLEVQVISYSNNLADFHETLCEEVQSLINDYLLRNLENVARFKTYIRCNQSCMGNVDGMVSVQRLKTRILKHSTMQCRHRQSGDSQTHTVNITEIARFWISEDQESLSFCHPEPGEHDEVTGESEDSISWPSLASLSSSGSGGSSEHKPVNIPTNTGAVARVPIEHAEESQENTLSKFKNFVKSKFQVLKKSNKELEENEQTERKVLAFSYQPHESQSDQRNAQINDSNVLLHSEQQNTGKTEQKSEKTLSKRKADQCSQVGSSASTESDKNCKTPAEYQQSCQSSLGVEAIDKLPFGDVKKQSLPSSYAGNLECRQHKGEENSSFHGELNLDPLGACGGTSYPYNLKPSSIFSSNFSSLNDKTLLNIARLVGNRETQLGLELNLKYPCIQRIKSENVGDATMQAFCILREWKIMRQGKVSLQTLLDAMANCSIDISSLNST